MRDGERLPGTLKNGSPLLNLQISNVALPKEVIEAAWFCQRIMGANNAVF